MTTMYLLPDEQTRLQRLQQAFYSKFTATPTFMARAPGRVNLIGEHTDYNGGFVLPVAIDRSVLIVGRTTEQVGTVRVYSRDYAEEASFNLSDLTRPLNHEAVTWTTYLQGVAWAFGKNGALDLSQVPGLELAVEGNVPRGSGLSSSAAIEVATALALLQAVGQAETFDRVQLAKLCQVAENQFVGVSSGIMDQFISALGQPDAALWIDTRSLQYRSVPLKLEAMGYKIVAFDSAVPRSLAASAYNQRRAECEEAVKLLAPRLGLAENAQLRDISLEQFEQYAETLPENLRRRAHHVISEDARTMTATRLMGEGLDKGDNLTEFGRLLYASHASLSYDYEVSSDELDLLVELAKSVPGVVGARMTGAGFGGCTVNIVATASLPEFEQKVLNEYRRITGRSEARLHVCQAVEGGTVGDL